jgi:hypothetical protein
MRNRDPELLNVSLETLVQPADKENGFSLSVVVLCTGTPNARLAQYPTTPTSAGRISLHQVLRDLFWFRLALLAAE